MAIQLHQRRCTSRQQDESLDVALRQLVLTEEYVRGLLSLGQQDSIPPSPGRLSSIVADIERLILPTVRHAHVGWSCEMIPPNLDGDVKNGQSVRAPLSNVVLNAIEAAGNGGRVRLWIDRADNHLRVNVADTGSGPSDVVRDTMFEPFVTSKPEGVGLGLALSQAAAAEHGGQVTWGGLAARRFLRCRCLPVRIACDRRNLNRPIAFLSQNLGSPPWRGSYEPCVDRRRRTQHLLGLSRAFDGRRP